VIEDDFRETPELAGVFVATMPDCLLFDGWQRDGRAWDADAIAGHFGDLIRANREGLRALASWSQDMQVTIESGKMVVVLREISLAFAIGCVFEGAPVGVARMHTRRLAARVAPTLPDMTPVYP
jgi:hypothetical protein